MGKDVKIVSLNVRGLNHPVKRAAILSLLENADNDICMLQETHLLARDTARMRTCRFPHQYWSLSGSKK